MRPNYRHAGLVPAMTTESVAIAMKY